MPCQVSAQSVVANSRPLVQGSGVCAEESADERQTMNAAKSSATRCIETSHSFQGMENRKCTLHTDVMSKVIRIKTQRWDSRHFDRLDPMQLTTPFPDSRISLA